MKQVVIRTVEKKVFKFENVDKVHYLLNNVAGKMQVIINHGSEEERFYCDEIVNMSVA